MKGLAWLALIVAIIALILGWVAFNRSGQDLEALVEQEVQEAMNEFEMEVEDAGDAIEEETDELEGDAMMEDTE